MATREKTIIYAFDTLTTGSVNNTVTNLSQITLYIPESSPTFTSVYVELGWQDIITNSGGTISQHRCALRLGAGSYTTITDSNVIANTGENMSSVFGPFNFTSVFQTDWTGTSMTCDLQFLFNQTTGTTLGMRNVTGVIYITYNYDDNSATNATQIKTVRIPMESLVGVLPTTTNSNFGTNQIPQLTGTGGLLCENSPVIRDYFFLIEGNESGRTNSNDYTLSVNIDSGTPFSFGVQERALTSDRFCRWIYDRTGSIPSTTTTHNFQMWTNVATRFAHTCVDLIVTYEFNAASTTRVLNSIVLPVEIASPLGSNTVNEASRFQRDFFAVEPGTLTLKQSAFRIHFNHSGNCGLLNWRSGGQNFRTYTTSTGTQVCGMYALQQRMDSGSTMGSALSVSRGRNRITIDGYATNTATQVTNISGYITLNYESDLSPEGIGQHNNTVFKVLYPWSALLVDRLRILDYSFQITEPNYWIATAGFILNQFTPAVSQAVTFDVECLSGEGKGFGYYDIYADAYQADAERAYTSTWMRGRDVFKRFPQDVQEDRIDIEIPRDYRLFITTTASVGIISFVTYHTFSWEITGNISGSNNIDNISLDLIRVSDNTVMQQQTISAVIGSYTFTVYNDTELFYVSARQDDQHLGRSAPGTAS